MPESRKLAAILAADVVGFSRLVGADEDRTLARLRALRSDLIDPTIAVHHGRVVKRIGDGILIEFRSVVDAVRCAIEVLNGMVERNAGLPPERRIEFRVGIHLGDVVEESDGDLMGDGVNIAARLESIAKPGAICLSEDAYRQVRARLGLAVNDLGLTQLKNIAEPMRVYSCEVGAPAELKPARQAEVVAPEKLSSPFALPEKPSIAVLAFQNMSGDPEQEYFADGLVEDIITALSRLRQLFVIARNSTFTYKGRAVDIKQVGRDLGVRYVVEGSVRKAVNQVRITAQLIDALTGAHLWADRFDGALDDVFALQDQVTMRIVGAVAPNVERAEIERAMRKPTASLDAYDYYLRGMACIYLGTKEANSEALRLFRRAVEIDSDFASAQGMAAYCYVQRKANGWLTGNAREIAEAARLARQAVELSKDDPVALSLAGHALAHVVGELDDGIAFIDRALVLSPNLARAWYASGWARVFIGDPELAIEHLARAIALSPLDPLLPTMQNGMAFAHYFAGRYDEASSLAEKAVRGWPNYAAAMFMAATGHALAGRLSEAQRAMARFRQLDTAWRVSNIKDQIPLRRPEDLAKLAEGARKAGLPE